MRLRRDGLRRGLSRHPSGGRLRDGGASASFRGVCSGQHQHPAAQLPPFLGGFRETASVYLRIVISQIGSLPFFYWGLHPREQGPAPPKAALEWKFSAGQCPKVWRGIQ